MRLSKPIKPRIINPVESGFYFKCTCGNRLCDFQKQCEICEAIVDWSSVRIKGLDEIEKKRCRK